MAASNTPCWEAPKFSINAQNDAVEHELPYTRALYFLEALDINPDKEEQGKIGWHQIKMLEGDDCQALQTVIDNNTIFPESQCTPP